MNPDLTTIRAIATGTTSVPAAITGPINAVRWDPNSGTLIKAKRSAQARKCRKFGPRFHDRSHQAEAGPFVYPGRDPGRHRLQLEWHARDYRTKFIRRARRTADGIRICRAVSSSFWAWSSGCGTRGPPPQRQEADAL